MKTGRIICHAEDIELYSMSHADALKPFKQESTWKGGWDLYLRKTNATSVKIRV